MHFINAQDLHTLLNTFDTNTSTVEPPYIKNLSTIYKKFWISIKNIITF